MTMPSKGLMQSQNISVQPLKCQTVWTPIRPGQNVGPDLGPNCLQRVISR